MDRPIAHEYLKGTSQFTYDEKLLEYYRDLEKYCDYLEREVEIWEDSQ